MTKYRIVVGRFDPLHDGHINLINHCLEKSGDSNTLIMLGSPNAHITNWPKGWENKEPKFSFQQRLALIRLVFPNIKIVPIPDMFDPYMWWVAFRELTKSVFPEADLNDLRIVVGEKAEMVYDKVYKEYLEPECVEVVDRTITGISGTKVREALKNGQDISKYVSHYDLRTRINKYWRRHVSNIQNTE